MPQLDTTTYFSQIFWLVITFGTLFLIMWRVAIPRITNVLEARARRIDDCINQAEALKKSTEETIAEHEKLMHDAHTQAQELVAEVVADLSAKAARKEASLQKKLKARLGESEAAIMAAKDKALTEVADVASEIAIAATQRLTGEAPTASVAVRAVKNAVRSDQSDSAS